MLLVVPGYAQRKQIGEARTILLRGKDFAKAEKMMTDLLKDSVHRDNKRIYDVWLQAVEKQYDALNERMYKHQAIDTTQLFNLTRRMFTPTISASRTSARPSISSSLISTAIASPCSRATTCSIPIPAWARQPIGPLTAAIA